MARKREFEVVPQIGVASYRIDLAVRHPKDTGRYILALNVMAQPKSGATTRQAV
jgi:hypothetical protein